MKKRGIGVGSMWYGIGNTAMPNPAGAFIDILPGGKVNLFVGAADIGQGSDTTLAQIAAEEIGVNIDDVIICSADTGSTPDGGATSASRQTYISGRAVLNAAQEAKRSMIEEAAELFNVTPEEIITKNRLIYIRDSNCYKGIEEIIKLCHDKGKITAGNGWFNPETTSLDEETGQGNPYGAYAFATQIAVVDVDALTGEVDVINVYAAHDVGQAINPIQVEAQIQGGVGMGIGFALYEEIKKKEGQINNSSFATYLIPTSMDMPEIHPLIIENPVHSGPYGAKGVGEPALIPTAAAIANAIYNAVGIRVTELPIKQEDLLEKLNKINKINK